MIIQNCDKCGVEIEHFDAYTVGMFSAAAELCGNCFEPYLRKLKRDKILPKKLSKRTELLNKS